jgi:hypothetical protein
VIDAGAAEHAVRHRELRHQQQEQRQGQRRCEAQRTPESAPGQQRDQRDEAGDVEAAAVIVEDVEEEVDLAQGTAPADVAAATAGAGQQKGDGEDERQCRRRKLGDAAPRS